MRELVRYVCSSCGGALIVDRNQGVYDCPFCGNAFDGAVIHRDEVLSDAENNLKQREFHSAKEKFDSMLDGDPHDFDALRGWVLCAGKLPSVNTLRKPDKVSECDLANFKKALDDVLKKAPEEYLPYFEKLSEMHGIASDYKKLADKKRDLDKAFELAKIKHNQRESSAAGISIFVFLASLTALFIWFLSNPDSFVNCAVIAVPGELALFAALVFLPLKFLAKRFDKEERGFRGQKQELADKISEVEERYGRACAELDKLDVSDTTAQAPADSPAENLAEE